VVADEVRKLAEAHKLGTDRVLTVRTALDSNIQAFAESAIDDALREEGYAREIVHTVQNARKSAGLQVEDRIELALHGDLVLMQAADSHRDYIATETLALELLLGEAAASASGASAAMDHSAEAHIDGLTLNIALRRAPHTEH